jgi:hypothetical protein
LVIALIITSRLVIAIGGIGFLHLVHGYFLTFTRHRIELFDLDDLVSCWVYMIHKLFDFDVFTIQLILINRSIRATKRFAWRVIFVLHVRTPFGATIVDGGAAWR